MEITFVKRSCGSVNDDGIDVTSFNLVDLNTAFIHGNTYNCHINHNMKYSLNKSLNTSNLLEDCYDSK